MLVCSCAHVLDFPECFCEDHGENLVRERQKLVELFMKEKNQMVPASKDGSPSIRFFREQQISRLLSSTTVVVRVLLAPTLSCRRTLRETPRSIGHGMASATAVAADADEDDDAAPEMVEIEDSVVGDRGPARPKSPDRVLPDKLESIIRANFATLTNRMAGLEGKVLRPASNRPCVTCLCRLLPCASRSSTCSSTGSCTTHLATLTPTIRPSSSTMSCTSTAASRTTGTVASCSKRSSSYSTPAATRKIE